MDDEDDPDLRAAIEASLQDIKGSTAGPDYLSAPVQPAPVYAETHHSLDFMPHVQEEDNDDEEPLTSDERENVQLFESLLTRIRDSGQDIRHDPQIQYLHESIEQLHPKITDAVDHVDQRHKELIKLHDRILTAIRIYDQLLDKRLRSSSFLSTGIAPLGTAPHTSAPTSMYPTIPPQSPLPASHQSFYQPPSAQPTYLPLPQQQQPIPSQPQHPDYLPQSPQGPVPVQYTQPPQQQQLPPQQNPQHTQSPLGPQPTYSEGYALPPPQQLQQQLQQLPPQAPVYPTPTSQPYASTEIHAQAPPMPASYSSSQPQSPPVNPHYVPPAMHVPDFPVLQPTSTHAPKASATPALPEASAPPVAAASAPEEVPLIEF
ncbi:Vacuolar protein-sorting-associated protein 27 [Linderina pennispora]|nr:Vacuolar protein-sorting-associated protein 27 [Linderina pennispora]